MAQYAIAVVLGIIISATISLRRCNDKLSGASPAYILESAVVHARLLPKDASHKFTYPTLSLLVSLKALETHSLDLARGWLFGYGRNLWRVLGIRPSAYLTPGTGSIREKLADILIRRGFNVASLDDAWMLTMPSYFGFEGINPLTVYFCYNVDANLELVVLEIHNTFGERHIHVLSIGSDEDKHISSGFAHQWTIAREFHVSPFNDRAGFYTVSVTAPSHAPNRMDDSELLQNPPRPIVRIHMHDPDMTCDGRTQPGSLRLTALLRPLRSSPLCSCNILAALARQPYVLLLSSARILYHAWILHYTKRLRIFPRPDPLPSSGGVLWQPEGLLEAYARRRVAAFLTRRAQELGISVSLIATDLNIPPQLFLPSRARADGEVDLTVRYLSPQFFTTLFLAPSAAHALLVGRSERLFVPSDEGLFAALFSPPAAVRGRGGWARRLRVWAIPAPGAVPAYHFLDDMSGSPVLYRSVADIGVVGCLVLLAWMEKWMYTLAGVRFVEGSEPWGRWKRAFAAANEHKLGDERVTA